MISTKKTNPTRERSEQFVDNCQYLGLKLLAEEYRQLVDQADKNTLGYYEFIRGIVHSEAAARQQRRIEYLVKNCRLPQPLVMLAGFDFDLRHDRLYPNKNKIQTFM